MAPPDPVVIASLTRSGSTMLQRVLSSHQDLVIWGEHFGVLSRMRNALELLEMAEAQLAEGFRAHDLLIGSGKDTDSIPPQVNPFDLAGFEAHLRRFVVALFTDKLPPGCRWGFKEVHYFTSDLRFLQRLFPEMRLIVLVRRPAAQVSSYVRAPWRELPEVDDPSRHEAIETMVATEMSNWAARYGEFMRFVQASPSTAMVVRYEDLADPTWGTDAVFAHCGLAPPPRTVIEAVRSRRVFSSDDTAGWPIGERTALETIIADAPLASGHDDVVRFYYPEDD
jgi:hypothetical protein